MSDIDYDEIDKAMQSVGSNKLQPPVNTPLTPLEGNPSVVPAAQISEPVSQSQPISVNIKVPERPTVVTPVAPKSSGRFMDVVHPSSDMRPTPTPNIVQPKPEDTSSIIQVKNLTPTVPKPVETVAPVAVTPPAQAAVNSLQPTAVPTVQENDEDADIEKLSDDINKTLGISADKSLETPFIPDVPVEKRPLGAFSNGLPNPELSMTMTDQNKVEPVAEEQSINTPLPAELQNDLLSIESSTVAKSAQTEMTASTVEEQNKSTDTEPIPIMAVPQQFQDKSKSESVKVSPIYDNNGNYNKALLHPAKNKGWMWIIWIVLLIVAGAGVGVAAYLFLLPNL